MPLLQRQRHLVPALVGVAILFAARLEAAVGFGSPFHPSQCDTALRWAERALTREDTRALGARVHAEALYCRALSSRDRAALDDAIEELRAVGRAEPASFFAALYLAEAVSRRFPLSADAVRLFAAAALVLETADVGEARPRLLAHMRRRAASVARNRELHLPILRRQLRMEERGILEERELGSLVSKLAQVGPEGLETANAILDKRGGTFAAEHHRARLARERGRARSRPTTVGRGRVVGGSGATCSNRRWR